MVLFHLYYSLYSANKADKINNVICYNIDLFGTDLRNSQNLSVNVRIASSITNILKNIYKQQL